jgi:hypothetical protein
MRPHTLRGMKAEDICIAFIEVIFADDVVLYSQRYEDRVPTLCVPMHNIEVISAGIVDAGKCYTNYCGCSRK